MTLLTILIYGLGLLCVLTDFGSRLFGSYARTPVKMFLRISLVVFIGLVYSLPFFASFMFDGGNLNILIYLLALSAVIHFLLPVRFGIHRYNDPLIKENASDLDFHDSISLRTEKMHIESTSAKHSLDIIVISDLHCNSHQKLNLLTQAIGKLNHQKIDLLFLLGDFTEDATYLSPLFQAFEGVNTGHGKYLVRGNHDHEQGRAEQIAQLAQKHSITLLDNKTAYVEKLGITLVGTEKPWFASAIKPETSGLSIGLSHSPDNIKYFSKLKVPLVLAGHTHGGKMQIPFIDSVLVPSRCGRFLNEGWFKYRDTLMYITKGVGYFPGLHHQKGQILKLTLLTGDLSGDYRHALDG